MFLSVIVLGSGQLARDLVVERVHRAHDGAAGHGEDVGTVCGVAAHVGWVAVDQPALVIKTHPVDREALRGVQGPVDRQHRLAVHTVGRAAAVRRDPASPASGLPTAVTPRSNGKVAAV
jgi:hypothetical protein